MNGSSRQGSTRRGAARRNVAAAVVGAALAAVLVAAGCAPESSSSAGTTQRPPKRDPAVAQRVDGQQRRTPRPAPQAPAGPTMPKVVLTAAHQKLCTVNVDDPFPQLALPRVAAEGGAATEVKLAEVKLAEVAGERLTVVFFWTSERAFALTQLGDMSPDVAAPFSGQGVNVVGIAVGESAETAAARAQEAGVTFPTLLDADGAAFALVGSGKLPRTYLLDADGKILWFDIEYSRSTRRDLLHAIEFRLQAE